MVDEIIKSKGCEFCNPEEEFKSSIIYVRKTISKDFRDFLNDKIDYQDLRVSLCMMICYLEDTHKAIYDGEACQEKQ